MGPDNGSDLTASADNELRCARHPSVETALTCGRCGTPICPRCLVQTPVGAKCPVCANVRRLPTVDVKPVFLARGVAAAIGGGAIVGGVWGYVIQGQRAGYFGIFLIFIAMGVGWAIGESVSVATNRKRATALQACAVLGVFLAYLVHNAVAGVALLPAGDIWGYIAVAVASFVAADRLRP